MPQSLSKLYVHLIFSTQHRESLLIPSVRGPLHAYLATVLKNQDCPALKIGGTSDHAHLLFRLSKNLALAEVVEKVKTSSSKWLKTQSRTLQWFYWQNGYGGFSVSPAEVDSVAAYIEGQEEHHRVVSFQEEYRSFLKEYGVEYDERYVWD
jgi:REP element-mobilizing transposase RayT